MNWKRMVTLPSICVLASLVLIAQIITRAQSNQSKAETISLLNPYELQVNQQIRKLKDASPSARAGAATSLGFLRAYSASQALTQALKDKAPEVRREAVLALAWCGGRPAVNAVLSMLNDTDWSVRQAAAVTLDNLTGMDYPFDGLANVQVRQQQIARWRNWWARASHEPNPSDVMSLLDSKDLDKQLRGIRAVGAIGNPQAAAKIVQILNPYIPQAEVSGKLGGYEGGMKVLMNDTAKRVAETSIRTLGRLRAPETLPVLIGLLDKPMWGRYAAYALGDFQSADAVAPLIAVYPRYSVKPNRRIVPELCAPNDCVLGGADDQMLETPYAILQTLSRLPLNKPEDVAALRKISPYIVANIPRDVDSGMIYQPEAYQLITRYVLDKAGVRDQVCDAAFKATDETDKWFSASVIKARYQGGRKRGGGAPEQPQERVRVPDGRNSQLTMTRNNDNSKSDPFEGLSLDQSFFKMATDFVDDVPTMSSWLPCLCAERQYVSKLISLMDNENGWIRMNAVKSLMFANAKEAVEPIAAKLAATHPEVDYGYSGASEEEPYEDPTPRWRQALITAIGYFHAQEHEDLLINILQNPGNIQGMQYVAAQALDQIGSPEAVAALKRAAENHPFNSVRLVAREALWRRGIKTPEVDPHPVSAPVSVAVDNSNQPPKSYVFIRGDNKVRSDVAAQAGVDPWRQTYSINNNAPAFREGRNLYILNLEGGQKTVTPLTTFDAGYVADCEVSWDGKTIIFARKRNNEGRNYANKPYTPPMLKIGQFPQDGKDDPWWHIWEVNVDGTNLHQVTHGPYHDVAPAFLPDGRIVFASTRMGLRDEYHMYMATGLTVMNADGSDIQVIGENLGADRDPSVLPDGRIAFSRLDVFYSRLKTEVTIQAVYPDGTHDLALYGPERRPFWAKVDEKDSYWDVLPGVYSGDGLGDNRNRVLKLSQAQGLPDGRVVAVSPAGLFTFGPGRTEERLVPHDRRYAVTSPFPIGGEKVVAAASLKQFKIGDKILDAQSPELEKYRAAHKNRSLFTEAVNMNLGLYIVDLETGEMTLLHRDPNYAEFEARPIVARTPPPVIPDTVHGSDSYTAKLFAASVFQSRFERVRNRAKLIRVVEGQPYVVRHSTQKNVHQNPGLRWRNHGGTLARILGTFPVAADGSFNIEIPADRMIHLEVLDSDRQVLGNQTFWMYARPGETRGCVSCHEPSNVSVPKTGDVLALKTNPLVALPQGSDFTYRAKVWMKGGLPDEAESRLRTVQAVNLIGR